MTDDEIKAVLAATPDERACVDELIRLRWPMGPRCDCGCRTFGRVATRPRVLECRRCGRQRSVTAGTLLERQKVPIRIVFAAARCLANPTGVAAAAFSRVAEIRYETVWRLFHRLRLALDDQNPFIRGASKFTVVRVWVPTRPDGFDRRRRDQRSILDESAVVGVGEGTHGRVLRVARPGSELGALMRDREEKPACAKCAPRPPASSPAVQAAEGLVFTLGHVHGAVGKRWFDAYLREHEFRANRRVPEKVPHEIVRRQTLRSPSSFRALRDAVTPRRCRDERLPPPEVPGLPRREDGTAPRWLPRVHFR